MFPGLKFILFSIIILMLFIHSTKNVVRYNNSKDKIFFKKALILWLLVASFIGIVVLLSWYFSPISVDKHLIIGTYEIDTKLYPGKNANWQKEHFRFQITEDDQFIFYERLADKTERVSYGRVKWAKERTEKWSILIEKPHHVIDQHPVLYRSNRGFYYVFRSKLFGNMFFRKVQPRS